VSNVRESEAIDIRTYGAVVALVSKAQREFERASPPYGSEYEIYEDKRRARRSAFAQARHEGMEDAEIARIADISEADVAEVLKQPG
jgi:DNA-directed RNA polymerase specialized sigma24 family protein